MRVLFWGTPLFAVPTLRALAGEGHEVVAAVTQPDRPRGRGRKLQPSAVREVAEDEGVPVLTPERPRGDDFLATLRALEPDVSVVVAYGHILVREVLDVPRLGSINVHASLLPLLRGAAPINWAILRGHARSGVTVMRMVEAMDAGPILLQESEPIGPRTTATDLAVSLSELGAEALVAALALMDAGVLEEKEQEHERATYAPKIDRETARIDWSAEALEINRLLRGMDRSPGAWTELEGQPVKLFSPRPPAEAAGLLEERGLPGPGPLHGGRGAPAESGLEAGPGGPEPGTVVLADDREGLGVATGGGTLVVEEVQPPGKRRMKAVDWIRGRGVAEGQRFE